MPTLTTEQLAAWRARTFRLRPDLVLQDEAGAVEFVNERGFTYFWSIKNVTCPSIWAAVAGDRPVPSNHDDPGHVTWGWKDNQLDKRNWYYAKVLRGKATMISLDVVPFFYALTENYGNPEEDYLQLYRDGLLSQAGRAIFEALLAEGPLDTITLRRKSNMPSKSSKAAFDRGLAELQRDFKILPVGTANTGGWRYSFIYALTHHHYPGLPAQARPITRSAARKKLLSLYLAALGAATERDVKKLFQWKLKDVKTALAALTGSGQLHAGYRLAGAASDKYFVVDALV